MEQKQWDTKTEKQWKKFTVWKDYRIDKLSLADQEKDINDQPQEWKSVYHYQSHRN